MKAGDVVKHRPTGETWLLAYAEGGRVSACGWPESIAEEADCELVKACSIEEHEAMLREWADKGCGRDHRVGVCRRQLSELEKAKGA